MNYFQKELIRLYNSDVIKYECERRKLHQISASIEPPMIYGEITGSELGDILPSKYIRDGKEYWTHRYIRDKKYKLTNLSEYKRFLSWNLVDKDQYVSDFYDCDNFSLHLTSDIQSEFCAGLAFGIMDVPGHSKNIFVTSDKKVYTVEPQSDVVDLLNPNIQVTFYLM